MKLARRWPAFTTTVLGILSAPHGGVMQTSEVAWGGAGLEEKIERTRVRARLLRVFKT